MNLWLLINTFLVWFCWQAATEAFEEGNTKLGYFNLFASSLNAVIVLDHFT